MRRVSVVWVLILLVSVGLRAAFTALPRVVRWDEAGYQLIARSLRAGQGYHEVVGAPDIQQPPMVTYLSVLGQAVGLPIPWATAGPVHVLLGGLLPLPVFGLTRRMFGSRRAAGIAALLAAVHPALAVSPLYWSSMTEPAYTFFILCGLYATWRAAESGSWRWGIAVGLAFGLAYLTRPEALAYLAVALLFVGVRRLRPWRRPSTSALTSTLVLSASALLVFLAAAAPYVIYLHRVTGHWAFSGKQGISMEIGWAYVNRSQAMHDRAVASLDSSGKEIMWLSPEQFEVTFFGWIQQAPHRFLVMLRTNLGDLSRALFRQDLFGPWTVALMVLGLCAAAWTKAHARGHLLLLLALAPLASVVPFFVLSRFLQAAVPIGLIWAALGLEHLMRWIAATWAALSDRNGGTAPMRRGMKLAGLQALPVALVLAAYLWGEIGVAQHEIPRQPFWCVQVADWLVEHVPAGAPLMMRDSEIALYANLAQIALPNAEWSQALAYGQARGARYLIVDDNEIQTIRPDLAPLLDQSNPRPLAGLTAVARLAESGHQILIYAIDTP